MRLAFQDGSHCLLLHAEKQKMKMLESTRAFFELCNCLGSITFTSSIPCLLYPTPHAMLSPHFKAEVSFYLLQWCGGCSSVPVESPSCAAATVNLLILKEWWAQRAFLLCWTYFGLTWYKKRSLFHAKSRCKKRSLFDAKRPSSDLHRCRGSETGRTASIELVFAEIALLLSILGHVDEEESAIQGIILASFNSGLALFTFSLLSSLQNAKGQLDWMSAG